MSSRFLQCFFAALAVALLGIAPSAPAQSVSPQTPAILRVSVVPVHVQLGAPLTATVQTTTDVVSVRAHVAMFNFNIPKQSDGMFSGTTTVPRWARLFHGHYAVRFVAQTSTGAQTQASTTVQI